VKRNFDNFRAKKFVEVAVPLTCILTMTLSFVDLSGLWKPIAAPEDDNSNITVRHTDEHDFPKSRPFVEPDLP